MSRSVAGYALMLLAACFWGGSASLGKHLIHAGLPTIMLTELRALVSGVVMVAVLLVVARTRLRIAPRDAGPLAVYGVVTALVNLTYYEAVSRLPIATAVFIQFTAPALVFAVGVASGREQPRVSTMVALVLSLAGTYLIVGGTPAPAGGLPWSGLLYAAASTVTYTTSLLLAHRLVRRLPATTVVAYGWIVAALFWAAVQPVPATVRLLADTGLALPAVAFACLSTLIPMPLFTAGLSRVSATGGAIASSSETVAASAIAFLLLGESLGGSQVAGGALILTAVVLLATRPDRTLAA